MDFPTLDLHSLMAALLVFTRISLIIIMLPVLGQAMVPAPTKIGLAALLSLVIYPLVVRHVPALPASVIGLAALEIKEILIAGMLALLAQLIFAAAQMAGQVISYQMGLAVANIFDPITSSQGAVTGQFASTVAMLVWLAVGAHHIFLFAISNSFALLPIGASWSFHGWQVLNHAAAGMFVTALRLVAPVLLLMLFLNVALGLVSRAVPQIQVFFVSFPLLVGVGLLAFALSLPAFAILVKDNFAGLGHSTALLLHAMAGR
ncbi:MAG TPA: flagellar biosynthetic protein FliR [Mariprofundaceae bacterium]|nr:flagellar biosynthetic protein FliR [Mariprofundaceae bacterium]